MKKERRFISNYSFFFLPSFSRGLHVTSRGGELPRLLFFLVWTRVKSESIFDKNDKNDKNDAGFFLPFFLPFSCGNDIHFFICNLEMWNYSVGIV